MISCNALVRRAHTTIHGYIKDNGMGWDFRVDHIEGSHEGSSFSLWQILLGLFRTM